VKKMEGKKSKKKIKKKKENESYVNIKRVVRS
jgi:hypothetical protein